MTHRHVLAASGFVFFVSAIGVVAAPAEAVTAACGQTITQDTALDADVGPCPGNGLVVGASHITLDLNGHSIFGSSSTSTGAGSGVLVSAPHQGVTVRNGSVRGFGTGVAISHGSFNTVERLVVQDNLCDGVSVAGSSALGFPPRGSGNSIQENVIRRNGCGGVVLSDAAGNVVQRNDVEGNRGAGISLFTFGGRNSAPRGNSIRQNVIRGNGSSGVSVSPFGRLNSVAANVITANGGDGVRLSPEAHANRVVGNHIRHNTGNGVVAYFQAFDNHISQNVAVENGQPPSSYDLAEQNLACANTWMGNTFLSRNRACIG